MTEGASRYVETNQSPAKHGSVREHLIHRVGPVEYGVPSYLSDEAHFGVKEGHRPEPIENCERVTEELQAPGSLELARAWPLLPKGLQVYATGVEEAKLIRARVQNGDPTVL